MKIKPIKIGKYRIKNPVFLAPMVDVTDMPYRVICRKAGAGMAYTEMLYVDAITHENDKTKQLMEIGKGEKPSGIQITGNNIEEFRKVIPYLKKFDIVDLNCGCPSVRIVGNEAGSYLLRSPEKIAEIVKLLKKAGLTVSVKIRLGFERNNVIEIAKMIQLEDITDRAYKMHKEHESEDKNGEKYIKEGLPERRLLNLLKIGPISINNLKLSKDEANVALGILRSKFAIEAKKSEISLTEKGNSLLNKNLDEEEFLYKIPSNIR